MKPELLNKKNIEKLGWRFDHTSKYNDVLFCDTYIWKPEKRTETFQIKKDIIWNRPTLTIYYHEIEEYLSIIILKFQGTNSYYGRMSEVFHGKCKSINQLKLICELVELDNYKKLS